MEGCVSRLVPRPQRRRSRFLGRAALNVNAVKAMGNDELQVIAAELVTHVRNIVTIERTTQESARAIGWRKGCSMLMWSWSADERGIWWALASGQLDLQRHWPMITGLLRNIDQIGSR